MNWPLQHRETGWLDIAWDKEKWEDLVNMVMNPQVLERCRKFGKKT
jgi:hypothetical protein